MHGKKRQYARNSLCKAAGRERDRCLQGTKRGPEWAARDETSRGILLMTPLPSFPTSSTLAYFSLITTALLLPGYHKRVSASQTLFHHQFCLQGLPLLLHSGFGSKITSSEACYWGNAMEDHMQYYVIHTRLRKIKRSHNNKWISWNS